MTKTKDTRIPPGGNKAEVHATASTVPKQIPKQLSPWKPGQSGNPAGRAVGSRNKFSEAMVSDFLADWHAHGTDVLARVRATDPATYLRVAAVLLPKTLDISVEQKAPGGLDPDEWQILRRVVDLIKTNAPGGDLGPTLQLLEDALRSERAQLIEAT